MKRHSTDVAALVCALILLAAAGAWLAWDAGAVTGRTLEWTLPVGLIVAGLVGVVASVSRRA